LAAGVLGHFLIILDTTIVNVALPVINDDLGAGVSGLQWVIDGYTLMFAALLLGAGALTDRFGARQTLVAGLVVFTLASVGCGLAPDLTTLVGSRFLQGSAAAVIMPSTMALISQAHTDPVKRARAIAIWAVGGAAAASSGLVMGGLFSSLSWRLIFLANVPVCLVSFILLTRLGPSPVRRVPFDWLGQTTAVVAMGAIVFGAIESGAAGLGGTRVITAFAVGAVAVIAFVVGQARVAHPMLPLELFRSRNISVGVVVGFAYMAGTFGMPFVMSLYLQDHKGLSPLQAGITFLPMLLSGAVLTPFSAPIAERFGARPLVLAGLTLMSVSLGVLAFAPLTTPVWGLALLMVPIGVSGPLVIPPVMVILLNAAPVTRSGLASATFNTSRQLGAALAVAIFGALLVQPAGFADGMRLSILLAAAAALAAAAISPLLTPRSGMM
jgi:EmrB/QacA subfamily drug resistance transporter